MRRARTGRVGSARSSALRIGAALVLALFAVACSSDDTEPAPATRDTIVVLWWEGVPPELCFDAEGARDGVMPTLATLGGLRSVSEYVPSSDRSETRLSSLFAEEGRFPAAFGPLDWGARRRPEQALSLELREAGYLRCAAVSRAELACLEPQFDLFAAPPFESAPSATAHDAMWRALSPAVDEALAGDRPVFLLVATDVLARRDPPSPAVLAAHLAARLAALEQDEPSEGRRAELASMRERLALEPAVAAEALRTLLGRRRGDALWNALQAAEADARLARADALLADLLARLEATRRRARLRLVVAGGSARDPWSAAFETNADGAAPLYTLGLPRFDGVVQEQHLRAALRTAIEGPVGADVIVDRPEPREVIAVLQRAGETKLRLTVESADGRRESWLSDVAGDVRLDEVVTEDGASSASEFSPEDALRVERLAARNALATPAKLELTAEADESVGGTEAGRRTLALSAQQRVELRATRLRPACVARWSAADLEETDCTVGPRALVDTDLPVIPRASGEAWPEEAPAPRLDLVGAGPWREVTLGAEGDGAAELLVEAWPARLDPEPDWLELGAGVALEPHPLRPGAWIARGEAPLEVRILRRAGGELAFRAALDGERVGAEHCRIDGERAVTRGAVTILLSAGVWNDATLYGAPPERPGLGIELLGSPPPAPITLPGAAERRFLLRAAKTR